MKDDFYKYSVPHAVISVFLPYAFIICYDSLFMEFIGFKSMIPSILVYMIFTCGIMQEMQSALLDRQSKKNNVLKIIDSIRNCILTLALYGFISFFFLRENYLYIVYILLLAFFQWYFSYYIHNNLNKYRLIRNNVLKDRGNRVDDAAARNYGHLSHESYFNLKGIQQMALIFEAIALSFLFFLILMGFKLSALSYAFTVSLTLSVIIVYAGINFIIEQQALLFKGFAVSGVLKGVKTAHIIFFFALSVLIAGIVTFRVFLFDYTDLLTFILWLISIVFKDNDFKFQYKYNKKMYENLSEKVENYQGQIRNNPFLFIMMNIVNIVMIAAMVIFVILIIYFLIKPFLKRGFIGNFRRPGLLRLILRKIRKYLFNIYKMISGLLVFIKTLSLRNYDKVKAGENAKSKDGSLFKKSIKTKAHSRQVKAALKVFLDLVKWGRKKGCEYDPCLTPEHYIDRLYGRIGESGGADLKNRLNDIVRIMGECLFSDHAPDPVKFKAYRLSVRKIIRGPN